MTFEIPQIIGKSYLESKFHSAVFKKGKIYLNICTNVSVWSRNFNHQFKSHLLNSSSS